MFHTIDEGEDDNDDDDDYTHNEATPWRRTKDDRDESREVISLLKASRIVP